MNDLSTSCLLEDEGIYPSSDCQTFLGQGAPLDTLLFSFMAPLNYIPIFFSLIFMAYFTF